MFQPIILLLQIIICYSNTLHSIDVKDQSFSDVLKNITLANKILQDLIKNYEQLEKIHQSKELLQTGSTSTENDQTFKSWAKNKPRTKQKDTSKKKYTSKPFIGTAMVYESLSNEQVAEESNEETQELKNDSKPVQLNLNHFKDKKFSNEDLNTKFKILHDKSKNKSSGPNTSVRESESKSKESSEGRESKDVEQIIIQIPKEVSGVVLNTSNDKKIKKHDPKKKPITNIWGTKTRFSIQHTANRKGNTNLPRDDTEMSRAVLRSRNKSIEKIIQPKIISSNKTKKNISINKLASIKEHREDMPQIKNNSKSKNKDKITLLILTNNKNANYDWNKQLKEMKNKQMFPNNEDSPNDILFRNGYGDTCLQMPIKKCKKALQIVNKNICKRRFKCKSDFKSDFIQNSKDGCSEEFAYREKLDDKTAENGTKGETNEKFSPPEFRELKKKSLKNDRREKKDSLDVLPKKLQKLVNFISLRNETTLSALLRLKKDRYEKKCQKESIKKCNNACSYALKQTCSIHACEKNRKKAIKSECKTQCKIAFKDTKKGVKSSSKSDSENDSESESDSESASD